jgi:penicillin-binding protein 1C
MPDVFATAEICKTSGHIAGRHCEDVETSYILSAGFQTNTCPYHTLVHLSSDERYRVFADCYPIDKLVTKSWFVLPPVQEWFYKRKHPNYKTMPEISPVCNHNQTNISTMEFIYPNTHNTIVLSRQLDGSFGEIALELSHRRSDAIVYWHLNETYIGSTQYFHTMSISPKDGRHRITVVDQWGNTISRNINTQY